MKQLIGQAGRYVTVGILVVGADYFTFVLAMELGFAGAVLSNAIAKIVSTAAGYWLHKRYTFAGRQNLSPLKQASAYFSLAIFNLGLASTLIYAFTSILEWPALIAKVSSDVAVILISFLVSKFYIYAPSR